MNHVVAFLKIDLELSKQLLVESHAMDTSKLPAPRLGGFQKLMSVFLLNKIRGTA